MKWKLITENKEMVDDLDNLVLNIVDDDLVEEGVGKLISYAILSSMLGSAGIVEGAELDKNMEDFVRGSLKAKATLIVPGKPVTITKGQLKGVVDKSKPKVEMVGKWELTKSLNVIARTLYMEDRNEEEAGIRRIMTVLWNRAGGDRTKLANVCMKKSQFSCWKELEQEKRTPEAYVIRFPKGVAEGNTIECQAWNTCLKVANEALDGRFSPDPQIGNRNIYSQPKDSETAKNTWGKLCDLKIGFHTFGYDKSQDGFRKYGKKINQTGAGKTKTDTSKPTTAVKLHTVKDGETIWSISGKKMSVVNQIKALNDLKSDTIKPGQVLKVPV